MKNWFTGSLIRLDESEIEFNASYSNFALNIELGLPEDLYIYLLIKNLKSEVSFINLGFFEKGKHIIDVELESKLNDPIILVQVFSSKNFLLTSKKLETENEIFNFITENCKDLKTAWRIVFRGDKSAFLKLYSNHGTTFAVNLDGKPIGKTPIFTRIIPGIHKLIFQRDSRKWSMILNLYANEIKELDLSNYIHDGSCKVEIYPGSDTVTTFDFSGVDRNLLVVPKGIHAFEVLMKKDTIALSKNVNLMKDTEKVFLDPDSGVSSILLKTNPRSMIFLNGILKGLSDKEGLFFVKNLDRGIVVIKIVKSGYFNEEFPVVLKMGVNVINHPLVELSRVLIKTNIKPVKIFLDGKYLSTIDKKVQYISLPKGEHMLRFENPYCYTIQGIFDITEGDEIDLLFQEIPLYLYEVINFNGKILKIDLISSKNSVIDLCIINENEIVFEKRKALKEGHNYFEIKDLKERHYIIKLISGDIESELEVNIRKDVKFEMKKLLKAHQSENFNDEIQIRPTKINPATIQQ